MEQRHGMIELLLRRWVAGGGKMHRAELFRLFTRCAMLMFLRRVAAGRQGQKAETVNNEDSRAQHRPILRDCSDNCSPDRVCRDREHKTHAYNYNFMDAVLQRPRSQAARPNGPDLMRAIQVA